VLRSLQVINQHISHKYRLWRQQLTPSAALKCGRAVCSFTWSFTKCQLHFLQPLSILLSRCQVLGDGLQPHLKGLSASQVMMLPAV
jgi:hypothetical protein